MRKPRDIDAELKALQQRQKELRGRRIVQLGELMIATGADALDAETLAGALLDVVGRAKDTEVKEAWRRAGAGFFRRDRRARKADTNGAAHPASGPDAHDGGAAPEPGGDAPG
jgi:hypothetical protein